MIKSIVDQYFDDHAMGFPDQGRVELDRALLFFGGQSLTASFFLLAAGPRLLFSWAGASLHLSAVLFVVGVACVVIQAKKRRRIVQMEDFAADDLLALVFKDADIDRRVKKLIAIDLKRQGHVSYRQLLAYGELSRHKLLEKEARGGEGMSAFIRALDDGSLG